jgi:hypothetical protein
LTQKKHDLEDDLKDEGPTKRRRVVSFAEYIVDDSEGDDEDFLLSTIEKAGYQHSEDTKLDEPLQS